LNTFIRPEGRSDNKTSKLVEKIIK